MRKVRMSDIKDCTCKDWENGRSQLIMQAIFCERHGSGPKYDGPYWRFCPWCGNDLQIDIQADAEKSSTLCVNPDCACNQAGCQCEDYCTTEQQTAPTILNHTTK